MRAYVLTVLATGVLAILSGCSHPAFTGTLNEAGSGGPTPPAGAPNVTSLSPSSVAAGGPAFTLTVGGVNFAPGDSVIWGAVTGCVPVSTYISSTEMQAQIPALCIAQPGGVGVEVEPANPAPLQFGGQFMVTAPPTPGSAGFTVTHVSIQANDMVWDPTSQQIYLSVTSANGTNGSTITALNPLNGQLGTSQNAGGEPHRLALASDGSYLYAGIDANGTVQRFTLPNLATDIVIPLAAYSASQPYYAVDVEAAPGHPHTIAVVGGNTNLSSTQQAGVTIYDDAVPRPVSASGVETDPKAVASIVWSPDAANIYGAGYVMDSTSPDNVDYYALSVDASGAHIANQSYLYSYSTLHYAASTGYLYDDGGDVLEPSTGAKVASFPMEAVQPSFGAYAMVPDETLNIAYYLGQSPSYPASTDYVLEAFDLTHNTLLGSVEIPNVVGIPVKLIRWGTNGLAFLTSNVIGQESINTARPVQGDGVYLISGAFVTTPSVQYKAAPTACH